MNEPHKNSGKGKGNQIHVKRVGRELAMQYLFQGDLNSEEERSTGNLDLFWRQAEDSGAFPQNRSFRKARTYAEKLIEGVQENLSNIDETLRQHSNKWNIDRMAVVDRNIMRVAVYEMLFCPDVPPIVSINEAVEIAKDFSAEKSGQFINGILNGVKDGLDRPERTSMEEK